MDFSKIWKAIAGGLTGAVTGGGVAITLQPGAPSWERPVLSAVVGFVVGFAGVYFAPANAAAPKS